MYYARLEEDLRRGESMALERVYGLQLFHADPLNFSEHSLLSLVNTSHVPLDNLDKLLLFNDELATWVFLEGRERVLYDYLREGVPYHVLMTASLLKINGLGGPERLTTLLRHLYKQGILSVNGKIGLNQKIYQQGPIFKDIPMIELLVTKRCNLGCAYCFAESNQKMQDMELKTALKAVDHLMEMPFNNFYIKFNGGEPLLRRDLLEEISRYTLERFQQVKGEGYLLFEVTTGIGSPRTFGRLGRLGQRILLFAAGAHHQQRGPEDPTRTIHLNP